MGSVIGKRLDGRYEITELIGVGGMADVYKATDIMEDRTVAVKILKDEFSNNEEFLRRFRNESKAIAVLNHPNIVKIYDVGFTDEIQFIVMEYIDGITMKEFIEQQGVLRWKDGVHFITQILRALQHAHDKGIVHRDIKPQNIMLFPDGTIKVMDFGIARFSRVDGKTLSDKTIGSVHYISPEQARGDMTDERSDIYSVGVMFYEMLTGQKPFDGDSAFAIARKHTEETPAMPRDIMPSIPEALEEIILHAMERYPERRYQSASDMIKDLDTFKLNRSVSFGYKYNQKPVIPNEEGTKHFKSVPKREVRYDYDDDDEDDDDDDDEEEEVKKRSYIVPIMLGVTAAVVIIAAVVIAWSVIRTLGNVGGTGTVEIIDFVGKDIVAVEEEYGDKFKFEIAQEYNSEYEEGTIFWQGDTAGKVVKEGYEISLKVSMGPRKTTVPDVKNMTVEAAENELKKYEFVVQRITMADENVEEGRVIKTQPAANEKQPIGSSITVYVSTGPVSTDVKVPYCLGLSKDDAIKLLKSNKLTYAVEEVESESNKGKVIQQSEDEGTWVPKGTCITIGISTGEVSPTEATLPIAIPAGAHGSYRIDVYLNGNIAVTQNIAKAETVAGSNVNITVKGKKTATYAIYITNDSTKKTVENYIKFDVDFANNKVEKIGTEKTKEFDSITPTTTTTTTAATTTTTTTTEEPYEPAEPVEQPDDNGEEGDDNGEEPDNGQQGGWHPAE